jgi:predicted porin
MKKLTLVATGVLSLIAAPVMAQSTVTLYGVVDAAVTYQTNFSTAGSRTGIDAGQLATSRWGIRGSEDLGGGMKAFFTLESTIANDTGAAGSSFGGSTRAISATPTLFDREAIVGLSSGFGSVRLGRQNILGVDSIGQGDPIGLAHPGTNPNVAFSALNAASIYGPFGTNGGGAALRQNNAIRYLTPVFSGFGGALMYGAGEQAGSSSAGEYKGISGYYRTGQSGIALAYATLNNRPFAATPAVGATAAIPAVASDKLTLWGGGAKFAFNDTLTLRGTYAQNKQDISQRKIEVVGLGAEYALSPAFSLTGAYYNTKSSGQASTDGKADQYYLIGKYSLSKRTILYSTFTHARAGSATVNDQILAAGMIGVGTTSRTANRVVLGANHNF